MDWEYIDENITKIMIDVEKVLNLFTKYNKDYFGTSDDDYTLKMWKSGALGIAKEERGEVFIIKEEENKIKVIKNDIQEEVNGIISILEQAKYEISKPLLNIAENVENCYIYEHEGDLVLFQLQNETHLIYHCFNRRTLETYTAIIDKKMDAWDKDKRWGEICREICDKFEIDHIEVFNAYGWVFYDNVDDPLDSCPRYNGFAGGLVSRRKEAP